MATSLYDYGRNEFAKGNLLWKAAAGSTIRAFLVTSGYTPNFATDQFLSSIVVGNRMGNNGSTTRGNAPALTLIDPTGGVCDANDLTFLAVPAGVAYNAIVIFRDDGAADASSPLIAYIDGRFRVDIAADASNAATTVIPEDLPQAVDNAATFTKISGTGPATFVLSALAAQAARTLSVVALGSLITAGAVYEYPASSTGLPVTSNGLDLSVPWDNGSNKIFKL